MSRGELDINADPIWQWPLVPEDLVHPFDRTSVMYSAHPPFFSYPLLIKLDET